ncbi:hypothetical protein KC19_12G187100 [Ceratodon purpureus]|uniref:Uncharacterized protein n=1 Tax=Ceratodon purpureus TaxID=3225 RepID=A0A8T0GCV2_CERPU|nr:hypothetical protein KC19_12G187100 [Ceratodon purpureus]
MGLNTWLFHNLVILSLSLMTTHHTGQNSQTHGPRGRMSTLTSDPTYDDHLQIEVRRYRTGT